MRIRGLIEGFYGRPWTHHERLAWFDRLDGAGATHYVWAAKAEPRHRDAWRDATDARRRAEITGRAPLVWDNTPVNDGLMREALHLGPLGGRDPALREVCSGVLWNPMEFAAASIATWSSAVAWWRGNDHLVAWEHEVRQRGWHALAMTTAFRGDPHWAGDAPDAAWWSRIAMADLATRGRAHLRRRTSRPTRPRPGRSRPVRQPSQRLRARRVARRFTRQAGTAQLTRLAGERVPSPTGGTETSGRVVGDRGECDSWWRWRRGGVAGAVWWS